jgi:hypothetical protein
MVLKGGLMAAALALVPAPVKSAAGAMLRKALPWAYGRPTFPSIRAAQIIRPSPAALAAAQYREQAVARGISRRTAVRWQWEQRDGARGLPRWFDPRFRPSLRNLTPPHTVR